MAPEWNTRIMYSQYILKIYSIPSSMIKASFSGCRAHGRLIVVFLYVFRA